MDACFFFRASSTTYGQLVSAMEINHKNAEEIIRKFFEAVDRRFGDYRGLEQHFWEKNFFGKTLYEDENLQ